MNLAQRHLTEPFLCGGLWTTRAEVLAGLQEGGGSERAIGLYMMGMDRHNERAEVVAERERIIDEEGWYDAGR